MTEDQKLLIDRLRHRAHKGRLTLEIGSSAFEDLARKITDNGSADTDDLIAALEYGCREWDC